MVVKTVSTPSDSGRIEIGDHLAAEEKLGMEEWRQPTCCAQADN